MGVVNLNRAVAALVRRAPLRSVAMARIDEGRGSGWPPMSLQWGRWYSTAAGIAWSGTHAERGGLNQSFACHATWDGDSVARSFRWSI